MGAIFYNFCMNMVLFMNNSCIIQKGQNYTYLSEYNSRNYLEKYLKIELYFDDLDL